MELGVSHEQSLSSLTPIVDNTFDKYNKNLVPIRSLSDHDNNEICHTSKGKKYNLGKSCECSQIEKSHDNSTYDSVQLDRNKCLCK